MNANGSTYATFTATNNGTQQVTVNFVVTVCGGAVAANSCSASPTGAVMNPNDAVQVNVYFSGGPVTGSGTATLAAKNASNGATLSSAPVAVTVTPAANAPTVSLSPHVGDRIDVSQCVAHCFESVISYTTPAYVSRDVSRSLTLLHRSGRAYPHGKLALDVTDANAQSGSTFKLQLIDPNGSYVTFTNGSQSIFFARNSTGATRIAAQFNATSIPTSAKTYTAYVSTMAPGGSVVGTTTASVRIIIVNEQNSPLGAGVDIVGLGKLSFNQPDGVLVTDGSGSASFLPARAPHPSRARSVPQPASSAH